MKGWLREGLWLVGAIVAVLVVAIAWQSWFGTGGGQGVTGEVADRYRAPMPDRARSCRGYRGEVSERVERCLRSLTAAPLSSDARSLVDELAGSGALLVVGHPLDGPGERVLPDAPLLAALLATDEEQVAAMLRERGVRGVVVQRDLTEALDRDALVLSRLARHDHLEWFQLRRVTEHLMVYTVRRSSSEMPSATGTLLLEGLRARLEGRRPPQQTWSPGAVRLIASARLQGHTLLFRHATGNDLERTLDDLAAKVARQWDRHVAIEGHGVLADRLGDVRLELHVVMEKAPVEPRSPFAIFDLFEIGIDGFFLRRAEGLKDEKFTYVPGSESVPRAFRSADALLRWGVQEFGWTHPRPWEDPETRLEIMRTNHFMERSPGGGEGAVRLVRGMPESHMADLSDAKIRDMLVAGGEWWLRNMRPDNSINYKYWPEQNRMSTDYNEVRHILATRDLADTWRYRKDPRYLAGSRRAMDWLLRYAVRDTDPPHARLPHPPAGTMLFRYPFTETEVRGKPPNQKLGTVAVALLGWVPWAQATGDRSQDENIRSMARFVLSRLEPSGKFDPYFVHSGHRYYRETNDIVPGEAALALGLVAEYFDEPEWVDFFPKFLDYYEPWFRKRAARARDTERWPHGSYTNDDRLDLVQFGPWSVMASKQVYALTGDARAASFGLEVADWMIDYYQWSGDRAPFPDYVGGYYKMPTELPAMQSFCYSEGTAAAYHIAATFAPERKERYDRSTREAIRFLDVMQFDELSSYFAAQPELIHGGIKYAMNEQKVRIDYVGHGLSTLSQYLDARAADPAVALDLTIEEVRFDPAHAALWGRWRLDPDRLPEGPALTDEDRARYAMASGRMRFEITPEHYAEIGLGRGVRLPYTVAEVRADGTVVVQLGGAPASTDRAQREIRAVGQDRLAMSGGGITQHLVREGAVSDAGDESDPDDDAD